MGASFVLADTVEKLNLSTQVQQCDNNGVLNKGHLLTIEKMIAEEHEHDCCRQ